MGHIDLLYRLDELYGPDKTTVVPTSHMTTPPPSEILLMPVARVETARAAFVMRERFDLVIEPKWTVSVTRVNATRIPLYGLIDEKAGVTAAEADGFEPAWVYPSYANSPGRFTVRVQDE